MAISVEQLIESAGLDIKRLKSTKWGDTVLSTLTDVI